MKKKIRILGIIPARSGSKGIKKKNMVTLGGYPLIYYTFREAKKSALLTDVVVSTDSKEIADCAKEAGICVPFLRPEELAQDETPTVEVVLHCLNNYKQQQSYPFDLAVILQPTSPLRIADDIDGAIRLLLEHQEANSVISCYEGTSVHPRIMYIREEQKGTPLLAHHTSIPRQQFKEVYVRNGAVYGVTVSYLMKAKQLIGQLPCLYVMPRERSVNIDSSDDLVIAEAFLKKRKDYEKD
ncbi:cytidylyltransferase domain-containing protein [Chlamydiota bacterium]